MKRLLVLSIIFLAGCGECDKSNYYQIRAKNPDGANGSFCTYEAVGLGPCNTWQSMQHINFTDSCKRFLLSQIITRQQIASYQGKSPAN